MKVIAMQNADKTNELLESYEELQKKAIKIYPTLQETLETFNSTRIETEDYVNFVNLLKDNPLPTASNNTSIS